MIPLKSVLPVIISILAIKCAQGDPQQKVDTLSVVVYPQVIHEKVPHKTFNKLVFQNFTHLVQEVNFELSSLFYMKEGALSGDDAYKPQSYNQSFVSPCRIYKTDLRSHQYREVGIKGRPNEYALMQSNTTKDGIVGTFFAVFKNEIKIVQIKIHSEFNGINPMQQYWGNVPFLFNEVETFTAHSAPQQDIKLLVIDQDLYLITALTFMRYVKADNSQQSQIPYRGYVETRYLLKAAPMDQNPITKNKRFYTLTTTTLYIYELVGQTTISLVKSFENFSDDARLLASVYDANYFYVTTADTLYIIDITDMNDTKISWTDINGTCDKIEKFQTTLHLTCFYKRLTYIAEFYVLGKSLRINRFFAGENIRGRVSTRRIGTGKMAIVSDNEIQILGYGINKNVLLQFDDRQPQFSFAIRYCVDVLPLKIGTSNIFNTMVVVASNKLILVQIQQTPPELYCEFPKDRPDAQYQILMQFNTSRCSYIKDEEMLFYGNMESVCEISIPVLIQSKQVQLETKHTNVIMIIIGVLIAGVVLLLVALAIRYNRSLENRFARMQKQLERVRKGYKDKDDKKKADI